MEQALLDKFDNNTIDKQLTYLREVIDGQREYYFRYLLMNDKERAKEYMGYISYNESMLAAWTWLDNKKNIKYDEAEVKRILDENF